MSRLVAVLVGSLALLLGPASRAAEPEAEPAEVVEPAEWNQEAVTANAGALEEAVAGLRDALRQSRQWDVPTQKRPLYDLADKLRLIEFSAQSLHAELAKGAGRDETLPTFQRLQLLRRDAQSIAQRIEVSRIIQPQLARAHIALIAIEPYYAEPAAEAQPPAESEPPVGAK